MASSTEAPLPLTSSPLSPSPTHPTCDPEILTSIQAAWTRITQASKIYALLLPNARITHASRGHVLARLVLGPEHLNSKGGLHGSVSATIVDCFGGLAIAAWDGREKTGASVDINVSYLGVVGLGDEVEIEGRAERVGGTLAFTSVRISRVGRDGSVGEAVVLGRHTKFVKGSSPSGK